LNNNYQSICWFKLHRQQISTINEMQFGNCTLYKNEIYCTIH
jgi:hypothetical protein